MTTSYRIHPAIGIARLGNSETGSFLGPEKPGQKPLSTYKDGVASVLRQGARFRIYEYRGENPVREILAGEGVEITWKVHMVNRKGTGKRIFSQGDRNSGVPREYLIIDPGEQEISGRSPGPKQLVGKFLGANVRLGELRTDDRGRLTVLGGYGKSFSPNNKPLTELFNNDDWCDDTADGRISASVRIRGQEPVAAQSAWVIVGPPDFAPPVGNPVTLYDVVYQAALSKFGVHYDPLLSQGEGTVSFQEHVFPLLADAARTWWVDTSAYGHAPDAPGNFLDPDLLKKLRGKTPNEAKAMVLKKLRKPDGSGGNMPQLNAELDSGLRPALPAWKYKVMERWAKGDFDPDAVFQPRCDPDPFDLDRAALGACVGASFSPGIEAPRILREPAIYEAPFRIAKTVLPGTLTQGLAIPWQTDFRACGTGWWPAVRPNDVFRNGVQRSWAEGIASDLAMVKSWQRLGYVLPSGVANPELIEKDRDPRLAFDLELFLATGEGSAATAESSR